MTREELTGALSGVADKYVTAALRFDPEDAYLREGDEKMGKRKHIKRAAVLALAAALVLALGATAYAALDGAAWFKSWFAAAGQSELTEGQMAYIDQAAVGVGQSVTAGGWTVTLQSAMTDGQYCYMKLDVQAPEGTEPVTPFPDWTLVSTDPNAPDDLFSGGGYSPLDNGTDGVCSFLLEESIPAGLAAQAVDWSYPLTLTLTGLKDWPGEDVFLSEGPWAFQFTVTPPEQEEVELVAEPFAAKGRITRTYYKGVPLELTELEPDAALNVRAGLKTKTEEVDIKVTSLKLSPMGAVCTYEFQPREEQTVVDPWDLEITFAGSTVELAGIRNHWPAEGVCAMSIEFAAPIDLDGVTSVTFQGHELALPEK